MDCYCTGCELNHPLLLFELNWCLVFCTECYTCSANVYIEITFIFMFILYRGVCYLASMPKVLKSFANWPCVYNCKVKCSKKQKKTNLLPTKEIVFDKLVWEQKQKSFCFIPVLFFLLLWEKLSSAEQLLSAFWRDRSETKHESNCLRKIKSHLSRLAIKSIISI